MRRFLADIFSLSRFHIVLIASGGSLVFGWLLTGRFHPDLALIVALDWFLVNIVNRVVDRTEDLENNIRATELATRRRQWIYAVAAVLYVFSFALHFFWRPWLALPRLAYHTLGFIYNFRIIRWKGNRVRLKDLYFYKNSASCTGFLLTLFAYPPASLALRDGISAAYVFLLMAYFATLELSFEVIYDLRDVKGDRAAGVASYPVVNGEQWSGRLILLLNVASIFALLAGAAFGLFGLKENILVFAPALQIYLFLHGSRRGFRPSDCVTITWTFAAMNYIYCVWVLAGMPIEFPWAVTLPRIVEAGLVTIAFFCWYWFKDLYGPRRYAFAYGMIIFSSWIAEQSSISLYRIYSYSPSWELFIGSVPLAVILIWPMVVISTHHVIRRLGYSGWSAVGAGALMVAFDSMLIEVTCANAGLWQWKATGIFGVPIIGLLGWGAFAFGALTALEFFDDKKLFWMAPVSFITAHATLQILWRIGFKSISFIEIPHALLLVLMAIVSILLCYPALIARERASLALLEILPRCLAAQLMYYILFVTHPSASLILFALLFSPPYLLISNFEWVMPGKLGPASLRPANSLIQRDRRLER
jgi:4-hydroxybenzoate polyprenyltransferase